MPDNIMTLSAYAVLMLNFAGIIWGAAIMSKSVSVLNITVKEVRLTLASIADTLSSHDTRIAVVEERTKEL